jgi:hypothetical protein
MTKEFKLSEKLIKTSPNQFGWINEKDIKEFIRLLKEDLCLYKEACKCKGCYHCKQIDKLTGFSDEKEVQGE